MLGDDDNDGAWRPMDQRALAVWLGALFAGLVVLGLVAAWLS